MVPGLILAGIVTVPVRERGCESGKGQWSVRLAQRPNAGSLTFIRLHSRLQLSKVAELC